MVGGMDDMIFQGGRNWGAEGAQAPSSFLNLYSKKFKISQIRDENFFSI